jgi:hypothetical protein
VEGFKHAKIQSLGIVFNKSWEISQNKNLKNILGEKNCRFFLGGKNVYEHRGRAQ